MSKIYESPKAALDGLLFDGMTIMSGGFGLSGNPESLIPEIRNSVVRLLSFLRTLASDKRSLPSGINSIWFMGVLLKAGLGRALRLAPSSPPRLTVSGNTGRQDRARDACGHTPSMPHDA
jgi:hypothetical protein